MFLTGPKLTTAFNWVGKGEHLSKLNLVFVAGNGDQGRTRELDGINLTHIHIFRDEIKFFKSESRQNKMTKCGNVVETHETEERFAC